MAITIQKSQPLSVFAYGIEPIQSSSRVDRITGQVSAYWCIGFLHYWIDEDLKYHEEVKDTSAMPVILWVTASHVIVTLHGPRDFTIQSKP